MFHVECETFHRGVKYSTQSVKCSTEVLNVPRRMSNVHGGAKSYKENVQCSTEVLNIPTRVSNVPRRC